jgi:type II secretory pathway predicted ATPase ExeA
MVESVTEAGQPDLHRRQARPAVVELHKRIDVLEF